jgi:hypothetical protein
MKFLYILIGMLMYCLLVGMALALLVAFLALFFYLMSRGYLVAGILLVAIVVAGLSVFYISQSAPKN